MDLLVLLAIATAGVALIGLLITGLVMVPWLVLVIFLGLLLALFRLPTSLQPQPQSSNHLDDRLTGDSAEPKSVRLKTPTESDNQSAPPGAIASSLTYRGAKYRSSPESGSNSKPEENVELSGTYRGCPWRS